MKDFAKESLSVGIIGAGIMGRGIAQIVASAGLKVIINGVSEEATQDALLFICKMLDRAVEKGRMKDNDAKAFKDNISISSTLTDLKDVDIVIEAIVEKIDIKQSLFKELDAIIRDDCILATNTSSLSVTAVATAVADPSRVAGCHFFNPVPLMKLVEVIAGIKTSSNVIDQLSSLVGRVGHIPVAVSDSPGFLVNHMGRGLNTEGLRIVSESIAEPVDIDEVMRDCLGFRMGPFELMDLTALDVTSPVTEQIYAQYYNEPRLRPTPMLKQRLIAGLLGKKVGEGFYKYDDGKKIVPRREEFTNISAKPSIWISNACPEFREEIIKILDDSTINLDTGESPGDSSLALVTPLGFDCTSHCVDENLDPETTMAIDVLFNTQNRVCLMTNPSTSSATKNALCSAFISSGRMVTCINDSGGFIGQRIIANIINTVCEIAQQGIARPEDIDQAAQLGLGYPKGPLTLGDEIGAGTVLEILENMQAVYGDPRYRPSIWLKRRAMLGLSLLQTESA
jgi:3-hydroxybutyryl-CoA dehydrogenase